MGAQSRYRFLTMAATPAECEYIKGIAHEDGMTLSAFLRRCVEKELKSRVPVERKPQKNPKGEGGRHGTPEV